MKFVKTILILSLLGNVSSFFAGDLARRYNIVSDSIDKEVSEGKCLVYGNVSFQNAPFEGVKVSTSLHQFSGITDEDGNYEFLMDAKQIKLYAFQIGYDEVLTEKYNFKSGHAVHIDFFMKENTDIEVVLKPVIYAYNPEEIDASIKLDVEGNLTFTYPDYEDGWNVRVMNNGLALQSDPEKSYPYLFWEGENEGLTFQSSSASFNGCQINTDSTIQFLESQCANFGFTFFETADFITFWAPRIIKYPFAKIEFLVDDQYDVIGKLGVNPKPDNIRRVYILFKGQKEFNSSVHSNIEQIEPISRNGFTVIEWGGSELSNSTLGTIN